MSLVRLANICAHLQNVSTARLKQTCIPQTRAYLEVCLALQRHGFISSITRGTVTAPDNIYTPTTKQNISGRRLWLGMKYRDNEKVLSKMTLISKPSKRIMVTVRDLKDLIEGKKAGDITPLNVGEVLLVQTSLGVMDALEAVEKGVGGLALCRVN
ncbi:hypothetical protein YB2330_004216 [Saitoella coloradoensis]